jgi:hypothetical protein
MSISLLGLVVWLLLPPGLPSSFYGIVTIGADNLPATATVTARVNGVECGQSRLFLEQGQTWYTLDCLADDPETALLEGGRAGDVVTFVVRNGERQRAVAQTAVWAGGVSGRLDLRALPTAVGLRSLAATWWPWLRAAR